MLDSVNQILQTQGVFGFLVVAIVIGSFWFGRKTVENFIRTNDKLMEQNEQMSIRYIDSIDRITNAANDRHREVVGHLTDIKKKIGMV